MKYPNEREKTIVLYGRHSCLSAIRNPERTIKELLLSKPDSKIRELASRRGVKVKLITNESLDRLVKNSNHQGVALLTSELKAKSIEDVIYAKPQNEVDTIILADGVTDMGNIGAVIRTMACFEIGTILLPKHGAPTNYGELSKTSSGAIEFVNTIYITNTAETLKLLKKHGYWVYCFDCNGECNLREVEFSKKRVIILGGEHSGAKNRTKTESDFMIKIEMSDQFDSLNVAGCASIAMYEISRFT